nr:ricin-type beta-trefoil lectin domain protein [Lysobacter gilvus]
MWLTCGNYNTWHGERIDARHCTTREEAVATGFVRAVDALVTPNRNGAGYTLDVTIDGQPIYHQLPITKTIPEFVQFGLWAEHHGRPHHEVRNVRVTQDTLLVSDVNGRCVDVERGIAKGHLIYLHACHGGANQVFRFANDAIEVGDLCMDAEFGHYRDGTRVISQTCSGQENQRWALMQTGQLRSKMAGDQRCVTLAANGIHLSLQPCDSTLATQRFTVRAP